MRRFLKKFTEGNARNSRLINCADVTKIRKHAWFGLGTYQKLAAGEGRWKAGEGLSFLSPLKGRVMKKIERKTGKVTKK